MNYKHLPSRNMQNDSPLSSSSHSSLSSDDSDLSFTSKLDSYVTPKKKRYRNTIRDGVSAKLARYYQSIPSSNKEPENSNSAQSNSNLKTQNATGPCSIIGSESDLSSIDLSDASHDTPSTSFFESDSESDSTDDSESDWSSDSSSMNLENSEYNNLSLDDESTSHDFLFDNCRHTHSTSYTLVMLFVLKHGLSKEAFKDLLLLISSHLPASCNYAKSVYKVKEFLNDFLKIKQPKIHRFCEDCQQLLCDQMVCSSDTCRRKNARVMEFHDLHLENQLMELFQDHGVLRMVKRHIQLAQEQNQGLDVGLKDICDGSRYKKLLPDRCDTDRVLNLTFTMNTDGVAVFSSSKKGSLWPVYIAINEIPVKFRFSKKFILPCFLYCHNEKPNMLTYLVPLMEALKNLSEKGIEVLASIGKITIKAHLIAVTADLPARAMIANMKQFNGKFGCSFCLDEGESRPNCPMHRFWPYKESSELRTHQSYIDNLTEAVQSNKTVNGIKGACPLLALQYVDIPKIFVIDWMHCVLLGVTKSLMKLWFSGDQRSYPYYVGHKLPFLNQRLQKIDVPDFVSRTQRPLEDYTHWKATEFREWLLHFSVPVLEGVLPQENLIHYMLLVSALNLLNQDGVCQEDINYADRLLQDFCKLYPQLYGSFQQTMNVHLLKHLAEFVRLYGPLFVTSCFGFESMNAHLKNMVHGTRFINNQVSFAVGMTKSLPQLVQKMRFEDRDMQNLVDRLTLQMLRGYSDDQEEFCNTDIVGKVKSYSPDEEEMTAIEESGENGTDIVKFFRLRNGSDTIYSKDYHRVKTRNSYTVMLNNAEFCIILYFLRIGNNLHAMVRKLNTVNLSFPIVEDDTLQNDVIRRYQNSSLCTHIKEVQSESSLCLIPTTNIKMKCIYMKFSPRNIYVSVPPNLLEHS